ncbi:MAG TPA: DUF4062 domain-containing protein [Chitinophagaceae bacterium]|nr:DUF4062 domain-containing protein [Chitinophagaceae bacterium]
MAKYKVYISSTYRDLKEHRKQVIDFFGKKTIKENFDLLSMEGYVADDIEPAIECIDDVKDCNIYILILANRYGFIPPKNNPGEISVTEIEYDTAQADPQKTILAFFADETDPQFTPDNDADEALCTKKKNKLVAFKKKVREACLTHPEPFVSSYHLTLQIAESLMRQSFIAYKLDSTRAYCCDRVPQFSRFLLTRTSNSFKSIIIYGDRKELGLNLINRFNIFTLDLAEDAIQNQLVSFEDFLISEEYAQNRNGLLVYIYDKFFPNTPLTDVSVNSFLAGFKTLETPLVFVINCDAAMFEDNQLNFIKSFVDELYKATLTQDQTRIYLFLNIEDNARSATLEQQLKQLQQLPNQEKYLSILPRLQSLSPQLIKTWIINYITPSPGRAEELMDTCFSNLSAPLSMYEADKKIHALITEINNNNAAILKIIN